MTGMIRQSLRWTFSPEPVFKVSRLAGYHTKHLLTMHQADVPSATLFLKSIMGYDLGYSFAFSLVIHGEVGDSSPFLISLFIVLYVT